MITQVLGNLITYPLDAFIHQANCFCTMNSGVAKSVRETYPEVYAADCKTARGDKSKMGTFSFAKTHDGKLGFNLYSQYDFGYDGKCRTDYVAMECGLVGIRDYLLKSRGVFLTKVGIPCKMGCSRGGGSWQEVSQIIEEVFSKLARMDIVICEFNEYSTKDDDVMKKLRQAYKHADLMGNTTDEEKD
jgi:hypothetical protein